MKRVETGKQIRGSGDSWSKHLRPDGKRRANKGTRKALKVPVTVSQLHHPDTTGNLSDMKTIRDPSKEDGAVGQRGCV